METRPLQIKMVSPCLQFSLRPSCRCFFHAIDIDHHHAHTNSTTDKTTFAFTRHTEKKSLTDRKHPKLMAVDAWPDGNDNFPSRIRCESVSVQATGRVNFIRSSYVFPAPKHRAAKSGRRNPTLYFTNCVAAIVNKVHSTIANIKFNAVIHLYNITLHFLINLSSIKSIQNTIHGTKVNIMTA